MEMLAGIVWGTPTVAALLAVGVLLSICTRFVQVRNLGKAIGMVGKSVRQKGRSSFQAVCTALAGTVGTGNVAGVAGAIALGGPGAVFWMWVSAFLGMATKYAEVVLAMQYRRPASDGTWLGGPMCYIRGGLGESWKPLAGLFAGSTVLASFGMGNMAQVHTIVSAVQQALPQVQPGMVAWEVGVSVAAVVALVTLGGMTSVGRNMEKLVPLMAGLYILGAAAVLLCHGRQIGVVFRQIVWGAFRPEAVVGAGAGIGIRQAVRWGFKRGVFSNEAGLGSAPIAHAAADAAPEEQGLFGIFEVFLDTLVLCTLTALVILVSGVPVAYGQAAGVELVAAALETVFGSRSAGWLALSLSLLALATLISWQLYGLRCAGYLWGHRGERVYRICYLAVVLLGATMDFGAVWALSDVCNGLMCLPNLAALVLLHRQVGQVACKTVQFET